MRPTLSKIYYQDLNPDIDKLISQFNLNGSSRDKIVPVKYIDNYHIPFELD